VHHVAEALLALGGAFLVCGLVARAGVPIGLPTIPLFMLAGVLLGPHTPGFVLVGDPGELELVARLGLVFLLFYLGLEFSLAQLTSGGRRLAIAAAVYLALNIGGGLALGFALGWGSSEAFVVAGIVGISSSAIVTKLLVETRRLGNPETRVILGIIVIEDLVLASTWPCFSRCWAGPPARATPFWAWPSPSASCSRCRCWRGTAPAWSAR
jgi:CPA2 family monovalent cation:H+ antiporter-2